MNEYSITIERLTNWKLVKELAYATVSKDTDTSPSEEWKRKMLKCEHSPIRAMIYKIKLTNIPYYVSVHLSRHKFGVEHYVSTQRTDRTGEDRNGKRQDAPVTHTMIINAQAIINMSHKRLCGKASKETRDVWRRVKHEMRKIDPILHSYMVPNCTYRGGICCEFEPCSKTVLD